MSTNKNTVSDHEMSIDTKRSVISPVPVQEEHASWFSRATSWLFHFIWNTVLLGITAFILWLLSNLWQPWKFFLVCAFSGGGVVLRLARPKLAEPLNRLSTRLLMISLAAGILIPLSGCTFKGFSWLSDPVVPTAHGLVSRGEWFRKDLPEWWGNQTDACHKYVLAQSGLVFNINASYGLMIVWRLAGIPDVKSTTWKLPDRLSLNDDIVGYYKEDFIPIYRKWIGFIFTKPSPSAKPRDCVCLEGDCIREWDYAFGVQNPDE